MKKRYYNQYCALARALDVIGERWSLLLVRELLTGPKRFSDLLEGLAGMGTNLLAARIKSLERSGVIVKTKLPPPAGSMVYELTELGRALEPAVLALVKWGFQFLGNRKPKELSRPDWDIIAMKASFRPDRAAGIDEQYEIELDEVLFHARVRDGTVGMARGAAHRPVVKLKTDTATFAKLGLEKIDLGKAVKSHKLMIQGDKRAALRMLRIFKANP